MIYGLFLIS